MALRDFFKLRKDETDTVALSDFDEEVKQLAEAFDKADAAPPSMPPLEVDITMTPIGLLPVEILLLSHASDFTIEQRTFPKFWREQYGILHVGLSLLDLAERGFLTAASIEATLENQTVANLKQGLKALKLPLAGKKSDLIARLLQETDAEKLTKLFPNRAFSLTSSGIAALQEAMYIPHLAKRPIYGLHIWNLHRLVMHHPDKTYRELLLSYMEEQMEVLRKAEDFHNLRDLCYRIYNFHMEENKLKKALPHLAHTIYIDLSGAHAVADFLERFVAEKHFFPYETSIVKMSVGTLAAIRRIKESLNLSEEILNALLIQFFKQVPLPFHLFTMEECAAVIILELREDKERLTKAYELAQMRFQSIQ